MDKLKYSVQITTKGANIQLRPKSSEGIWVSFLLPATIILSGWNSGTQSLIYISCVVYSLNLLLNALHLYYHIHRNKSLYVTKGFNVICAIPSSITMYFYINYLHLNFRESLCYTIANALIYFEGLPFILKVFPKSFTFGEANLVIQGISIFLFSTFIRLNKVFSNDIPQNDMNISTTILQVGLLGMFILCIVPYILPNFRNPYSMYVWIPIVLLGFVPMMVNYTIKQNPFFWLWNYFLKQERFFILLLWAGCIIFCTILCGHRLKSKKAAETTARKYFHILADVVFITGIIYDADLLYFSSACLLAVFILLEVVRIVALPPFHEVLQESVSLFADEKDSGIVALTPIYLLIGNAIPLWIHPRDVYEKSDRLKLLSGILSIGIGDTLASIFGQKFGKNKWKDSNKTVQGTIASIFGQLLFFGLFVCITNDFHSFYYYLKVFFAIVLPSFVEAFTDQIDNIVLPFLTYVLLII